MNKTNKKTFKILIIIFLLISISFINTSTSYAANSLEVRAKADGTYKAGDGSKGDGTETKPLEFDLKYNEIIIKYADVGKIQFPFYFKIKKSDDMYIGKYMIDVDYGNKEVIFTRIGAANNVEAYAVSPSGRNQGANYVQAGAIYDESSSSYGFTFPLYKIVSSETFNYQGKAYTINSTLGNTRLQTGGGMMDNMATHPSTYVFCAGDGVLGKDVYHFTSSQVGEHINYKLKNGKSERSKIVDSKSTELVNYNNNQNMTSIVYSFHGSTSEILDQNQASNIEQIISKFLISLGDMFMKVVYAVGGESLNIDAIVFNGYEPVIVDFFETKGTYLGVIQAVVNGWYEAFAMWTRVVLIIVLVAIGVKAIVLTGTAGQNKITNMISGWFMALILFVIGPYFMKYTIALNAGIVDAISKQSKYSLFSVYNIDFESGDGNKLFQYGEDSQTEFIEYLYEQQEVLTLDTKLLEEEKERQIKRVNDFDARRKELEKNGIKVKIVTEAGLTHSNLRFVIAKIQIAINNGATPEEAYNKYTAGGITVESKSNNPFSQLWAGIVSAGNQVTPEIIENELRTFANDYKKLIDAQAELSEIERAITMIEKNIDLMGTMRQRATQTYRLVYVAVWYILIIQLVALMFIYYKRLLTVALLITIYPLVIMFYAIERFMGIDKPKSMGTWVKEYTVNIFIQSVHALLYVMLVEAGLSIFEADSDNWIIFVMAVYSLFPMEAIVKSIIGMKSSTVGDLSSSVKKGLGYTAAAGAIIKAAGSRKDVINKYKHDEKKIQEKEAKQDRKTAYKRSVRDRDLVNSGRSGAVLARHQARNKAADATADAELKAKRAKKAAARRRKAYLRAAVQPIVNASARVNAISTGIAGGADAEDFIAGAAVSGFVVNAGMKVPKVKDDDNKPQVSATKYNTSAPGSSATTASTTNTGAGTTANNTSTASNVNGGTSPVTSNTSTPQAQTYAGQQTSTNNGTPQNAGANNAGNSTPVQNAFRNQMGSRTINVNTTEDYILTYDDRESDE